MDDIRDIRKKKNLYFVLANELPDNYVSVNVKVAIIIFLYYEESLNQYLSYVDIIPSFIDVYIVTNNNRLYDRILQFIETSGKGIKLISSHKRGRDVSALLVACKDIVPNYEYICFIHDKKRKESVLEEDFNLWIENIWGNLIGSKNYILNVLDVLISNKKIGLLVPPEPIGKYIKIWYTNAWGQNFELTTHLAKEMELNCNLAWDKSPITLGTVFWAKSIALKKLFDKNWRYEDFDEEPLKDDGTISHAIERILGYVAQDAGYDTGTVMNTSYAEKLVCILQEYLTGIYPLVEDTYKTYYIFPWEFIRKKELIYNFYKENVRVYLYGAGNIGERCLRLLRLEGYEPEGYIVSDKSRCIPAEGEVSVKTLDEIEDIDKAGIIITVGRKLQQEIENTLKTRGIKNYIKYVDE